VGRIEKLVGDFYATGMEEKNRSRRDQATQPEMDKIEAISDTNGLVAVIAHLHRGASGPLFSFA